VESLEERIDSLVKQNTDLRNENEKLKHKIASFEEEKRQLSKRGFNCSIESNCNCRQNLNNTISNKKATLSLLAVIFMLGLNLAPFSGVLITNDKGIASVDSNLKNDVKHGPSRTLLWERSNDENLPIDVLTARENAFNSSNIKSNSSYNKMKDTNCKTYINQTESLRLESDLRGWVLRVKMEKEEVFKQKKRLIKSNKLKDRFNKPIPLPRLKAWTQRRTDNDISNINDYALESYNSGSKIPQIKYEDLLSAIHRRDDTFYFLSFSAEDHLIIPPIPSNGSEIRPRFSLIMPSINSLNVSSSEGTNVTYHQIVMMQIDCEVINTKMVLLNSSPNSKPSSESVNNNKKLSKTKPVMGLRNATKTKNNVQ
jgi:regulator of replication initiation timing